MENSARYEKLPQLFRILFPIVCCCGLGLAVYHLFGYSIKGFVFIDAAYYYLLFATFGASVFILFPARKKDKGAQWYDFVAAALFVGLNVYFALHAAEIRLLGSLGWTRPSPLNLALALIIVLLILEGGRRTAGSVYVIVCIIIGLYPVVASHMPGLLFGLGYSFPHTIGLHIFGSEGVLGIPGRVIGDILIGFLVFAGVLIASGAGGFFLNLAQALLGSYRGGAAKVAVLASGLFGSLSGSAVANIAATGGVTIPAMKRTGYPPHYAGAIEACASTGGMLMPPVMGAVAFIVAVFINVDYATVMTAALIPAVLYYFGLLMQVDAYAAKAGLAGLPRKELPSLKTTFKQGWVFIFVILFLVWGLLYMRWEALTPFYAAGVMVILSFIRRETMITPRRFINAIVVIGRLIVTVVGVMLPCGLIICGLVATGTAGSFTAGAIALAGGNVALLLLMGIVACYLLGMAGLLLAAYIFLAVILAPALVTAGGLNVLGVHLFILYYSGLSLITPPVAGGSFIAAAMAGANPMRTAFTSARLGIVIYFIPLFFVLNPALILQGPILETLHLFALCLLGIVLIAAGAEGYLLKIGRIGVLTRLLLIAAGTLIALPEWMTTVIGTALAALVIAVILRKTNNQ